LNRRYKGAVPGKPWKEGKKWVPRNHDPIPCDAIPLTVPIGQENLVFIAEDVGEKCKDSFLVVMTAHTGLRTQPRLFRFNFDKEADNWVIAS